MRSMVEGFFERCAVPSTGYAGLPPRFGEDVGSRQPRYFV
jgi:hypothetical protein